MCGAVFAALAVLLFAPPSNGAHGRELRPPARPERFHLFPELKIAAPPPLFLGTLDERRPFHQSGDPDSLFTFGRPTPEGQLRLKAAFEINEVFLRGLPPDPTVEPTDTRPRAAGSWSPLDAGGRPYQLRLGARLVW